MTYYVPCTKWYISNLILTCCLEGVSGIPPSTPSAGAAASAISTLQHKAHHPSCYYRRSPCLGRRGAPHPEVFPFGLLVAETACPCRKGRRSLDSTSSLPPLPPSCLFCRCCGPANCVLPLLVLLCTGMIPDLFSITECISDRTPPPQASSR